VSSIFLKIKVNPKQLVAGKEDGVDFMQRRMPESTEIFSSEQWQKITESLKPHIDKHAKPLKQRRIFFSILLDNHF